jgi:hypothetical protein
MKPLGAMHVDRRNIWTMPTDEEWGASSHPVAEFRLVYTLNQDGS